MSECYGCVNPDAACPACKKNFDRMFAERARTKGPKLMNDKGEAMAAALEIAVDALCPGDRDGTWSDGATGSVVVFGYDGEDAGVRGKDDAERQANAAFIAARTDIPALLDEVERKRDFARTQGDILHHTAELREIAEARATRAEAEVERLQHDVDRARGAQGELLAHAERLAGALEQVANPACLMMCPDVWPDETDQPHTVACEQARQALSAYRGEMKAVL